MTMAYGDFAIQRDLNFTINPGDVFIVMGAVAVARAPFSEASWGSSSAKGKVFYGDISFWDVDPDQRDLMMRRSGFS